MHEFHPAQRTDYSRLCVCCRSSAREPLSNSMLLVSISPICTWEGFLFCLCLSCKYANLDLCVYLWVFVSTHICRNICVLTYGYRNAIAPDYFQFCVETFLCMCRVFFFSSLFWFVRCKKLLLLLYLGAFFWFSLYQWRMILFCSFSKLLPNVVNSGTFEDKFESSNKESGDGGHVHVWHQRVVWLVSNLSENRGSDLLWCLL